MGALTSKPLAFTARPWEYQRIVVPQLIERSPFDRFLVMDIRLPSIVRILPPRRGAFISDSVRFLYDGLKFQRILRP